MAPAVSIIVPVFKTEKFLDQCVRSIVGQTFPDWELILVNDCSPDRSGEMIEDWARRDGRIRTVTHPENRGLSHTRFTGLARAGGRYVVWVDSDDWIPRDAIRLMYEAIEREQADVVIGSMVKVLDRHGLVRTRPRNTATGPNRTESITRPELMDRYYINYFGVNLLPANVCGKIYRREALDRAPLEPVPWFMFEDVVFNMTLHPYLSKIGFVADTVYYYRFGGGTSTSTPGFLRAVKDQYRLKERMIQIYNYTAGCQYINLELINCFYSHFANRVLLQGVGWGEVTRELSKELHDPIYGPALFEGIGGNPRADAMRDRDVEAVVTLVRAEVRRLRPRHLVKKAISKILS